MSKPSVAVGLRYDAITPAPFVVASGRGELATRLLDLAKAEGIPVRDAPDLADLLVWLNPGEVIPPEVYNVVAEILVQVMQLAQERGGRDEDSG